MPDSGNERKKLHLLLTRLPYPPIGGDKLKSSNLIKILYKYYNLHIVIVTDEPMCEEAQEFLEEYSTHYKVFHFPKWRFYLQALQFIFNNEPIQVNYYYFSKMQRYLSRHISEDDIFVCTLIRTAGYSFRYPNTKFLDIVDSISINYKRSFSKVESWLWKLFYKMEIKRLEHYEEKCISHFDSTFFVNKQEAAFWSEYGKTEWIPNGVNENIINYHYLSDKRYKKTIVFFGKMDYQPNIDAVIWFVDKCLPYIDKRYNFLIVGTSPAGTIKRISAANSRVSYTGFVKDPYIILASSAAIVAPMQTGGGIQNKILESMALGSIVITTSLGGTPIEGAVHGQHLFIEDDPYKMAMLINNICKNRIQFDNVGKNAKGLIKNCYTWGIYDDKLKRLITESEVLKGTFNNSTVEVKAKAQ